MFQAIERRFAANWIVEAQGSHHPIVDYLGRVTAANARQSGSVIQEPAQFDDC